MKLDIRGKTLLFDLDGTLVATEFLAQKAAESYLLEKGFPFAQTYSEMIVGRTWQAATQNMVEEARKIGVKLEAPEILRTEFKRRYRELFKDGVSVVPGLNECLPYFKAQAKFMGIVTGSERDEVESILEALGLKEFFERVWAYGDYSESKPSPAPYQQAVNDLGVRVEEVLVFEDSEAGMTSASRAGLSFVQITHEAHALSSDPRALRTLKNWTELL